MSCFKAANINHQQSGTIRKQEVDLNANEPGGSVIITLIKMAHINSSSVLFPFWGQ